MPLNQTLRKNSHVLWSISLIQDVSPDAQTKSEFLEMAEDIIATSAIEKLTICLADHLQRFRLMVHEGITEQKAIEKLNQMSADWYKDNADSLEKLKQNKEVSFITWDEFLNWPSYSATISQVETLYKENREFRNDVDGRIRQELKNVKSDSK